MAHSPLVENLFPAAQQPHFSDLQVLKSGGGWYIGTIYTAPEGFIEPGSRDSEYFPSEAAAATALSIGQWIQRARA